MRHLKLFLESTQENSLVLLSNDLRLMRDCLVNIQEFLSGTCCSSDEPFYAAPLWRCGIEGSAGAGGGARTHAKRGCVPERYRAPQDGDTPLHLAAMTGRASALEKILEAGAATDVTNQVRG